MSKSRESDKPNQLDGKKRPELALFEVVCNVFSTNIEELNTPRTLAVDFSKTALNTLRGGPNAATIEAYDRV